MEPLVSGASPQVIENWKAITGYEGRYEVSDQGRVRSLLTVAGTILSGHVNAKGYCNVTLTGRGRPRGVRVHRLVLEAFAGDFNGLVSNHKNGIRSDNRLANLEQVSIRENNTHTHYGYRRVGTYCDRRWNERWNAYIFVAGKKRHLGSFDTEAEASEAYQAAMRDYGIENRYAVGGAS